MVVSFPAKMDLILGDFVRLLTVAVGGVSPTLLPLLGILFLLLNCLNNPDVRVCALSYCILLHRVWLIYLGGLNFPEEKQRKSGSEGEGK